jgi:fatty acid synthase
VLTPFIDYLYLGDEESLSLELIQFLANRGARKFVLVSKMNKKPSSGYKNLTLRRLKNKNITVVVSLADPSTVKGAEDVLREAITLGPVGGIYYISTVRKLIPIVCSKIFIPSIYLLNSKFYSKSGS